MAFIQPSGMPRRCCRYARLREDAEDTVAQIETGAALLSDLQADLRAAAAALGELEDELERAAPVARDADAVQLDNPGGEDDVHQDD